MKVCQVCRGSGEVAAGITGGFTQTGEDCNGNPLGYPTYVKPNPNAVSKGGDISFTVINPLVKLWSLAVCQKCRGSGLEV